MMSRKVIRRLFICCCALLFVMNAQYVNAQGKATAKGDALFMAFDYNAALRNYQRALHNGESPYYTTLKIADCYRMLGKLSQAEEWYRKAMTYPDVEPAIMLQLANVLKMENRISEGNDVIKQYYQNIGFCFSTIAIDYSVYVKFLIQDSVRYVIDAMPVNTSADEFAPFGYGNDLYFSTNQLIRKVTQRYDARNHKPFFDLYKMRLVGGDSLKSVPSVELNTQFNDGPVFITHEGDRAFVTRNRESHTTNYAELDVAVMMLDANQRVISTEYLPFKADGFSVMHACLSSDSQKLFFASDMPGGYGGMDLYVSVFKDGFYSTPVNLGPFVNSAGNECFPFYSTDGFLFFSSDGWPGLGGYDLFYAKENNSQFSIALNMGYPLNSEGDDSGLVMMPDFRMGYFASNRSGGKGGEDIYRVSMNRPITYTKVYGRVIESGDQSLDGVLINVVNSHGELFNCIKTSHDGQFQCYLPPGEFRFTFQKRLMESEDRTVVTSYQWDGELELNVQLNSR